MKKLTISRRYATALLLIGKEDGKAEAYGEELDIVSNLIFKEEELQKAICNPLYEVDSRREVLQAILNKLEFSPVINSFLFLLFDKGRFTLLNHINTFYQVFVDELKGIARAELISARDLPAGTIAKVQNELAKMIGKEIKLEIHIDPALIGGIVTKIGDHIWDGSIKTQLNNMKESLKRDGV